MEDEVGMSTSVVLVVVLVLSSTKLFCLAVWLRLVRFAHGLTTAGLADQFAADG